MNYFNINYFILIILLIQTNLKADNYYTNSCNNITKALELNTRIYNKCLFTSPGEKYSQDDLSDCKKEYLTVIERLSYVYKNICNNVN